jgi:hypothetical protein
VKIDRLSAIIYRESNAFCTINEIDTKRDWSEQALLIAVPMEDDIEEAVRTLAKAVNLS